VSANSKGEYSDEEAMRRTNDALRRALTSPPKPHSAMKIGKRKDKREPGKPSPHRVSQEKADEPSDSE
jgi:hypothetical protein